MRSRATALGCHAVWAVLLMAFPVAAALAQENEKTHVKVGEAEPRPADVSTLDGIINAYYEVVSGPAGQPREWARDRTLYLPGARFIPTGAREDGTPYALVLDHQGFVDLVDAEMVREGFFEHEIHRVTRTFGNVTHVFSTYESRRTPDGPLIGRGINSIELFHDGKRWWIAAAMWDNERPGNPIPEQFLPAKRQAPG